MVVNASRTQRTGQTCPLVTSQPTACQLHVLAMGQSPNDGKALG